VVASQPGGRRRDDVARPCPPSILASSCGPASIVGPRRRLAELLTSGGAANTLLLARLVALGGQHSRTKGVADAKSGDVGGGGRLACVRRWPAAGRGRQGEGVRVAVQRQGPEGLGGQGQGGGLAGQQEGRRLAQRRRQGRRLAALGEGVRRLRPEAGVEGVQG